MTSKEISNALQAVRKTSDEAENGVHVSHVARYWAQKARSGNSLAMRARRKGE